MVSSLCLIAAGGILFLVDYFNQSTPNSFFIYSIAFLLVGLAQLNAVRRRLRYVPWKEITRFNIYPESEGVYQFTSDGFYWWGPIKVTRRVAVDFATKLSWAQYDAVQRAMERWRADASLPENLPKRQTL